MTAFIKKYGKYIASVVIAALLISGVPLALQGFKLKEARALDNTSEDEKKIAADISNMTGEEIEQILKLRKNGKTWNEILEKLKKDHPASDDDEKNRRNNVLAAAAIGDDYVEVLRKEGFTQNEITEANLLFERVQFQLQEIVSGSDVQDNLSKIEIGITAEKHEEKEDVADYSELSGKLDIKTAVYLMLKLKKDMGSIDTVMDEYLISLQLELDLKESLVDKAAYEKQKKEKSAAVDLQKIITLAKIEEMMLKKIQFDNNKNKNVTLPLNNTPVGIDQRDSKSPLQEVRIPEVKDGKPQNPANEIMKEIQAIDPVRNGGK